MPEPYENEMIAEIVRDAIKRENEACAEIALSIDSGRGNEKEIAAAIRRRAEGGPAAQQGEPK